MGPVRNTLLWASQNRRLREAVPSLPFVRRAVLRFMPGETVDSALEAARSFAARGIATTFTYLGENVTTAHQAGAVVEHYLDVLERVRATGLDAEISVKLTHLGLDLDTPLASQNLARLVDRAAELENWVWVDMESSPYVERTVDLYGDALARSSRVGLCLQAYLRRTDRDLAALLPLRPSIRLVKGAYREPKEISLTRKSEVDAGFERLAERMLHQVREGRSGRLALGTHDVDLIDRIARCASAMGLGKDAYEIQMLYGIREADQLRLQREGFLVRTLIAYGPAWYQWYMRRLAERPANLGFVIRNLFSRRPPPSPLAETPSSPGT